MAEQNVTEDQTEQLEALVAGFFKELYADIEQVCVNHQHIDTLIEGLEVGSRSAQHDVRLLMDRVVERYGENIFPLIIRVFSLVQNAKARKEDVDTDGKLLKSTILGAFDRFRLDEQRHGTVVFVPVMTTSCPTTFGENTRGRVERYRSQDDETRKYVLVFRDTVQDPKIDLALPYSLASVISETFNVLSTSEKPEIGDRASFDEIELELSMELEDEDDPTFQRIALGVTSEKGWDAVNFNAPEKAERLRAEVIEMLGLPESEVGLPMHPNAMGRGPIPFTGGETTQAQLGEELNLCSYLGSKLEQDGMDPAVPFAMARGSFQKLLAKLPDDQPIAREMENLNGSGGYDELSLSMFSTAIDFFSFVGSVEGERILIGVPYGQLLSHVDLTESVTDPVKLLPDEIFNVTDIRDAVEAMVTAPAQTLVNMGVSGQARLHQDLALGNTLDFAARPAALTHKEIDPGKDNQLRVALFSTRRTAVTEATLNQLMDGRNVSYSMPETPLVVSSPRLLSHLCPHVLGNMAALMRLLSLFYRVLGSAHAPALETDFHGDKVVVRSMDDGVDFEEETLPVEHWWSLQPFIQDLAAQNGVDDRTSAGGHA